MKLLLNLGRTAVGLLAAAYFLFCLGTVVMNGGIDYQLDQTLFAGCQHTLEDAKEAASSPLSVGATCEMPANPDYAHDVVHWRYEQALGWNATRWVHRYIPVDAGVALVLAVAGLWPLRRRNQANA